MFFDYSKIKSVIMTLWSWIRELLGLGSGESSGSADVAYSNLMVGLKNRIGDQVIGGGYIHKGDQLSVMQQGVDPRDLEKYLNLLDSYESTEDKEIQILDWYYAQDIDIALKDALLLVVSRIPEYIKYEMNFIPEKQEEVEGQLYLSLQNLSDSVKKYKFESLGRLVDLELVKLTNKEHKVSFLIEVAKVYTQIRQYPKTLGYLEQAYQILPRFEILRHIVELYKNLDNLTKVVSLLQPHENDENDEDRLFVQNNLGIAYLILGKIKEGEGYLINAISLYKQIHPSHLINNDSSDSESSDATGYDPHLLMMYRYLIYTYLKIGDIDEAVKQIFEACKDACGKEVSSFTQLLEIEEMTVCFPQIGVALSIKNDWDMAQRFFLKRLETIQSDSDQEQMLRNFIAIFNNLAIIAIYKNDLKTAKEYTVMISDAIDKFGVQTTLGQVSLNLLRSLIGIIENDTNQAYIYLNRIFEVMDDESVEHQFYRAMVYANLANAFIIAKDFDKARFYYDNTLEITDRLLGTSSHASKMIKEKLANLALSQKQILIVV